MAAWVVAVTAGGSGTCHLRSYGIQEIVERVQKDYLARQRPVDLARYSSYGRDLNTDLAELLLREHRRRFSIRVGMMTLNLVTEMQAD
jgi:hypothetical protein